MLYTEEVTCERLVSALAGPGTEVTTLTELRNCSGAILKAFAEDDDIQQLTVVSTNIGMVRRYTKHFAKRETP